MTSAVTVGIREPFPPGEVKLRAASAPLPGCGPRGADLPRSHQSCHSTNTWPHGNIRHPCPSPLIRNATATRGHQLAMARQGLGRESPVSGSLQRLSNLMVFR